MHKREVRLKAGCAYTNYATEEDIISSLLAIYKEAFCAHNNS